MQFVSIPLPALTSPEYLALSVSDRQFLLDLYVLFHDTERFTIDMDKPQDYRQPAGATLARKIRHLLDSGLLLVVGMQKKNGHNQRIFSLAHPARELYLEAA